MSDLWFALWFFLPAGLANASPVLASKIPRLRQWQAPLDFGKGWRGERIFGANKTWRGLLGGILIGSISGSLLSLIVSNYPPVPAAVLGGLLGLGALVGDAVESFIKRRAGVQPGQQWFPFDQIDYIVGGLLFSLPLIQLQTHMYWLILFIWASIHVASSYLAYLLGLKDKPI